MCRGQCPKRWAPRTGSTWSNNASCAPTRRRSTEYSRITREYSRITSASAPLRGDTPPPSLGAAPSTASGPEEPAPERPEPVLSQTEAAAAASTTLAELLNGLDLTCLRQLLLYGIDRG